MRPSRYEILVYAQEGLRTKIGSHPCPREYPEEINEYEDHLAWVEKEILRLNIERIKESLRAGISTS